MAPWWTLSQIYSPSSLPLTAWTRWLSCSGTSTAQRVSIPPALKGSDRARLDILARAAARLDYEVNLALLTHLQSGSVDYSSWDGPDSRYGSRLSRYSYFEEDEDGMDEDDGAGAASASFQEIFEESLTLDHWKDVGGRQRRLGKMNLETHELLSSVDETDRPCTRHINEATGNEGVTMDRSYRLGAVVIWPRTRYTRIVAAEGPETAVPALERMVATAKSHTALEKCRDFAAEIVTRWAARHSCGREGSRLPARMLKLLEQLGPPGPMDRFIQEILPHQANGSEGPALVTICNRFGWQPKAGALQEFFAMQKPENIGTSLATSTNLFEALCCRPPALTEKRRGACAALAAEFEQVIRRFDRSRVREWDEENARRDEVILNVFRAYIALGAPDRLDLFLTHVLAHGARYDLHTALVPAVQALSAAIGPGSPGLDAFSRLKDHCIAALKARTAKAVSPPADWRRDARIGCQCRDCRALVRFLGSPGERACRFPIGKDRRRHLHRQIDMHSLDLTHVTERGGRPETLVCTKTQNSYERRRTEFETDWRLLMALEAATLGKVPARGLRRRKT